MLCHSRAERPFLPRPGILLPRKPRVSYPTLAPFPWSGVETAEAFLFLAGCTMGWLGMAHHILSWPWPATGCFQPAPVQQWDDILVV